MFASCNLNFRLTGPNFRLTGPNFRLTGLNFHLTGPHFRLTGPNFRFTAHFPLSRFLTQKIPHFGKIASKQHRQIILQKIASRHWQQKKLPRKESGAKNAQNSDLNRRKVPPTRKLNSVPQNPCDLKASHNKTPPKRAKDLNSKSVNPGHLWDRTARNTKIPLT